MPRYAELIYNGFWFSPEREALQALIDKTQEYCTGACGVPWRIVWLAGGGCVWRADGHLYEHAASNLAVCVVLKRVVLNCAAW